MSIRETTTRLTLGKTDCWVLTHVADDPFDVDRPATIEIEPDAVCRACRAVLADGTLVIGTVEKNEGEYLAAMLERDGCDEV
jgi:hypothetical protein